MIKEGNGDLKGSLSFVLLGAVCYLTLLWLTDEWFPS